MKNWFLKWFNRDYSALYAERGVDEASVQVQFVLSKLSLPLEMPLLDVACGNGRHLYHFARSGLETIGIDLSPSLLEEAQNRIQNCNPKPRLIQCDMRSIPLEDRSVAVVTNFFTGFGYFDSDEEHIRLLREWHRVLQVGGYLVLDFLNVPFVLAQLTLHSEKTLDGKLVKITKQVIGEPEPRILKTIRIEDAPPREYEESVRMYTKEDFSRLFATSGFRLVATFGDFTGAAYSDSSPRLLMFAEASA